MTATETETTASAAGAAEPSGAVAPGADAAGGAVGVLELVGGTPLLDLGRLLPPGVNGMRLLAKAEHTNPGGSVKDRPAVWVTISSPVVR